jgi:DNA-directed RNA polymerase subunit L
MDLELIQNQNSKYNNKLTLTRYNMEIITSKRYEMEILADGETHTLCNAIRRILMEDENVKSTAYVIEHPIVGEPKIYVKAKSPRTSLKKASKTLKERCAEFKGLLEEIE